MFTAAPSDGSRLSAGTSPPARSPEGSLVRLLIREGQSGETATTILSLLAEDSRHEFWAGASSYCDVSMKGIVGRRQVTDAYLAHLARTRPGRLVMFDGGVARLHSEVADLVLPGREL